MSEAIEPRGKLASDHWTTNAGAVARAVPTLEEWTSEHFRAEYFFDDGDLIVHLFPEAPRSGGSFEQWMGRALEQDAPEYFRATRPELEAQYVPQLDSYWLCAKGAGNSADPEERARRFFERIEARLSREGA